MKKNLFVLLGLLLPAVAVAQVQSEDILTTQMVDNPDFEKDFFSAIDMKILHDPQIMQAVFLQMVEMQNTPMVAADGTRDKITQGVFNERDSDILETMMDNKKITFDITPELFEKAGEEPFEAFKDLVRGAQLPKLTSEELQNLNQIDDKAVSKMIQMTTESGPDFGARAVSVSY